MELRDCWPELRPEDCAPEESLSLPKLDAASFGFLEDDASEPCLGAEPSISKSVLWRFPLVVFVEGAGFDFALSSRSGSDEATMGSFSSLEVTVA